jgi:serine/threonine protein kinase
LLSDCDKKGTPLDEKQVLKIFGETAQGLKEMHDLGIFHQDVKVENILLTK